LLDGQAPVADVNKNTLHTSNQEQGNIQGTYCSTGVYILLYMIPIGLIATSKQVTSSGNATLVTQPVPISSSCTASPLSQYLVYPTTDEQANIAKKSLPKVRLLTSETCLAELKKKEEDKRKAAEEKERKKHEKRREKPDCKSLKKKKEATRRKLETKS